MSIDYWIESVESSLEEAGIMATEEQIANIAEDMEGSHECYDMAYGLDVAGQNWESSKDNEIAKLREELRAEQEKISCPICKGRGSITEQGPVHSSTSTCWQCRGRGRVNPCDVKKPLYFT